MKHYFNWIICSFAILGVHAQDVLFSPADSVKVVTLLRQARNEHPANLILFFSHRLEGTPYVANTLEVSEREVLVVNLRQMDCSTFVETAMALALTAARQSERWSDYCRNLALIRYSGGKPDGYASRNHYMHWWVESNQRKGLVSIPAVPAAICSRKTLQLSFMSTHVSNYTMLRSGGPQMLRQIRRHEKVSSGKTVIYIPASRLGMSRKELSCIHDGDILAVITRRQGLDTSHVGIAEWGSDGMLHMIHASRLKKKVSLDPTPLCRYMPTQRLQQGVWVIRPTL